MGEKFEISNRAHIVARIMQRYGKTEAEANNMVDRTKEFLEANTPVDWRFTESPSSRFFILDEQTHAKFMGLSYRYSLVGQSILDFIRKNIGDTGQITNQLSGLAKKYIADVTNPALPIVHDLRTVYGKGEKATIGEEKKLFHEARLVLSHTVPLRSQRIAARPNAVIGRDGNLWVRQYLNWMGMDTNGKEYYLFLRLTNDGLTRCHFTIFSYTPNGDLKMVGDAKELSCHGYYEKLGTLRAQLPNKTPEQTVRSESYWKVPTCLDRRYIDLDFKERYSKKGPKKGETPEPEYYMKPEEALELCFLKAIVERAKEKLHK